MSYKKFDQADLEVIKNILLALRIMKPVDFRPANMYIHLLKFHFPSIIKYIIIYKELLTGYGFTNLYPANDTIPSHNYM